MSHEHHFLVPPIPNFPSILIFYHFFFQKWFYFYFFGSRPRTRIRPTTPFFFSGSYPPHQIEIPLNTLLFNSFSLLSLCNSLYFTLWTFRDKTFTIYLWLILFLSHTQKVSQPKAEANWGSKGGRRFSASALPVMCYKTPFPIFFLLWNFSLEKIVFVEFVISLLDINFLLIMMSNVTCLCKKLQIWDMGFLSLLD